MEGEVEILRRNQVDATVIHHWEQKAKAGMRAALNGRSRDGGAKE